MIENFVGKCCILSSVNLRNFFLEILEYFNQIPLDMIKTKYNFPLFFNEEMKEKSITSFPLRLCTYYVSHSILSQVIYQIVLRTNFLKSEDYPLIYSTINQILFHDINEANSFKLDLINVSKWSIILHTMSKIIPDIIISDAFNHIQSSQLLHTNYHIFILRLYSFLYYPKQILSNFPLFSITFQHLTSILTSNRATNQLLIAGNKFIRNFLGYTIQYEQTPELNSLFKEINRCLTKIQNDQCSWNSTLVLFSTLSNDKLSFFPIQKYFSLISRQFPTSSYKIADMIKTFISILNGHFYMNLFTIEKIDIKFFKSAPNRKDKVYLQKMLDIIHSNASQFKHCQRELGLFLIKVASLNFTSFIRKQFNSISSKDFFQSNTEAVLYCATIILSNEAIILQNSKITSSNDPIIIQFKKSIIDLCQKVMDDHPIDLFTTQCCIFDTNDFTNSLYSNSFSYEIEQIVSHTSLVPLLNNEKENNVATDIFFELKKINVFKYIDFELFLNSVDESKLRYYQLNSITHSPIENVLLLCLLLAQEIEKGSPNVFNRIPVYLFSDSPFISALTIRIIQAFIHIKHDQSILNSLLTLQTFEYEQLYIYGLALIRTAKSMVNCKISLTVNSANSLLSWQWILLSAPFSIIRKLGLKLAEIIVPILPYENFPNVHKFIINHDEEIFKQSMTFLSLTFTYENFSIDQSKHFKFQEVMYSNSYLLYYTFFTNALKIFSLNEDKCPQLNHTMNVTHAQAISLINAKKNIVGQENNYFMLNLTALRLATSSVFDKYTSPEEILTLLRNGDKFLSKCDFRIYYLFFLSVNPCLELNFNLKLSSKYVDALTFHFRMYIIEYFKKEKDDTIDFHSIDYLNINNYKNIIYVNENDLLNDDTETEIEKKKEKNHSLFSIEHALQKAIEFFNRCLVIRKRRIIPIDSDRLVIISNNFISNSICNILSGLSILFEKMREKFIIPNNSFFVHIKFYKRENHIFQEQPFDPELWFPFIFNIATDLTNQYPIINKLACQVLSLYISFVQIPENYIIQIMKGQNQIIKKNEFKKFWTLFIIQYPALLLPFFCEIATYNFNLSLSIFNCFKKPVNISKDLQNAKEFIQKYKSLKNDFDKYVIENIGKLISLSFLNLSHEDTNFSYLNVIYYLSLFAIVSELPQSEKLIPILNQILKSYSSQNLPIPIYFIINLSKILSDSYKPFTEQFLNEFFELISANRMKSEIDMVLFIRFSIPWFKNIKLCSNNSIGIIPNCKPLFYSSYSFLKQLFELKFKADGNDVTFSKMNLPSISQSILNIIIKDNLMFIVDFVLHEKINEPESILIFLLTNNQKQLIPFFVNHIRFSFSYFMEIQNNQRKLYFDMINKILNVFIWILSRKAELISPYLHILFVFCYVKQNSIKSICGMILKEISKLLNESCFIDCLKAFVIDENISNETVHEIFYWMVSFDDLRESMFSIELFQYLIENKIISSSSSKNYICDINTNIKIICVLLNQCDKFIPSIYFEYISKLMMILYSLDSPPIDIAIELLKCNSMKFSPILSTSLKIVSNNIENSRKYSKEIFINLITADLNCSIVELIFGLLFDMIHHGIYEYKSNLDVFFFMIPYFQVNSSQLKIDFLYEIFGNEKFELIINSYKNVIHHDGTVSSVSNDEFDSFILEMVNQIPGETQFFIFSFFMKVIDIFEYKYFHSIYMISLVLLKSKAPHSALCPSVFSPLSKFLLKHQSDKVKMNEFIEFIRLFEGIDSNIFPEKKRNINFPLVIHDKKFEPAFYESYPVVLSEFKYIDSNLACELDSFVLSVQNLDLEKREKKYNELKMQKVEESYIVPFNFSLKNGIEQINKALNLIDDKKTYLIPSNVSKIINVDHSVFRTVEDIDELIE